jgi:hypothetical protein
VRLCDEIVLYCIVVVFVFDCNDCISQMNS